MPRNSLSLARITAYKILCIQTGLVLLLAIFWWCYQNVAAAWSATLGGVAWIVPNIYFVHKCFTMPTPSSIARRRKSQVWSQAIVGRFYFAEFIKFLSSVVFIVLFVKLLPLKLFPFLSGYIAAVLTIWSMLYVSRAS